MALLKKKVDPLTDRAKVLNAEIAALEAKIRKLNQQSGTGAPEVNKSGARVRSTALPHGSTVLAANTPVAADPVFEKVDQKTITEATAQRSAALPIDDLSTPTPKMGFL